MKINTHILVTSIALIASATFAQEPEKKNKANYYTSATASNKGGKATVTIDVNGKKETREIELGDGTEVKIITNTDEPLGSGGRRPVAELTIGEKRSVTWLGVAPEEVSEELRAQLPLEPGSGLIVRTVMPDSPAAKAGLQKNDVLMKIDDQLLTNPSQLRTLVAAKKDGETVKLTFFRRGQQTTLDVKLSTHEEGPLGALALSKVPHLDRLFQTRSKAVVLDKDGKVISSNNAENETVEKIAKTLRDVGVDQKSIDETTRILKETTKAIRDAVADANVAKDQALKGSSEIAKALEQVRDAVEKVRRQTEEAVRKDRENRREEKLPLEKP